MKNILKTVFSLIFPPRCAACRELLPYYSDALLCDKCAEKWEEEISSECGVCRRNVSKCTCVHDNCRRTVASLISVSAYTSSDSVTDLLVLAAKDRNDPKLFKFMSDKMTEVAYGVLPSVGDLLVTYVPRSASRKSETGHDQSEILAKLVANNFGAEMRCLFKKKGRKQQKKLGAKALFATHYHELTALEEQINGVKNYNIAVKKRGDDITFLRRIVRGGADDSYGIEVAKLSGIPNAVIERAKSILKQTENEGVVTYKTVKECDVQLPLEMVASGEIMKELKEIDVNTLTPIEAMQILFDLCDKAKNI